MNNTKRNFVTQIQQAATTLAALENQTGDIDAIWNHRLYGPGGTNEFTALEMEELAAAGGPALTADQLYAFVILCSQFQKFLNNQVPAVSDYSATINRLRFDL